MTLEKLQLIATAVAAPYFKVRWLENWNSGVHSHQAVHFPPKGFSDKDLESWLNKACFWAGVSSFGAIFIHFIRCLCCVSVELLLLILNGFFIYLENLML